jgi:hypothetical protein
MEFDGLVQTMADEYNVPIAWAAPYHPEANGMIECGQRTWINSLFVTSKGNPSQWSKYFYSCMWADWVTVKWMTGHTPYYLLYGKHHMFPFDIMDASWYTLNWGSIRTTEELIAIHGIQLAHRDEDIQAASEKVLQARIKSAQDYAKRNENILVDGDYSPGTIVLVYNSGLLMQHGRKGEIRWIGPYWVRHQNSRGSYELEELDGAPINGVFTGNRLKRYHLHDHIARMDNASNQSHSAMDKELIKYNTEKHTKNMNHTKTFERKIFTKPLQNPVSLGPENQLTTYRWPPLRATDSWGYWENKIVEWKWRNILKEISGKPEHEPQIIESDYDSTE